MNCKISLIVIFSEEEKKKKYEELTKKLNNKHIRFTYILQLAFGCLDVCGRLIIDDNSEVVFHPNGTGDLWGFFET